MAAPRPRRPDGLHQGGILCRLRRRAKTAKGKSAAAATAFCLSTASHRLKFDEDKRCAYGRSAASAITGGHHYEHGETWQHLLPVDLLSAPVVAVINEAEAARLGRAVVRPRHRWRYAVGIQNRHTMQPSAGYAILLASAVNTQQWKIDKRSISRAPLALPSALLQRYAALLCTGTGKNDIANEDELIFAKVTLPNFVGIPYPDRRAVTFDIISRSKK